ncbi:MAG: HAMP domain-containing sensor histidine kinase [Candidatus Gracilibacteria bacterium]|nr:HAMP domain-containing sensor histidine kinase [Candidatus Gracilibacteria bacterium]
MKYIGLSYTKKKLTVIFTLLVFGIAVLLEGVFFTFKYYNYINTEKTKFAIITNNVETKFVSISEFIINYDLGNRVFKMARGNRLNLGNQDNENFVNLLIINKDKRELIFSNVIDDLKLSFVEDILDHGKYGQIDQKNGFFVKKIKLVDLDVTYDVLFIKNLRYSFLDYLRDLLGFVWIMFLFSVLFFYVGYKFVSKNLEPVEKNLIDMQDFIHNAGHELKTPISIIHSNLQLIRELKKFDEELVLEGINEINRLNHLIESLVELSNISGNVVNHKIDIGSEIEVIIKDYKTSADKKNITVNFKIYKTKILTINKQYFYILFSNLLGNAIKYTKDGGEININLYSDKLSIKDNGLGISDVDKDKIFDRFYMGEKCRNNDGHGIGLSLVKKIADIYKLKIVLKSKLGDGSEFIIIF